MLNRREFAGAALAFAVGSRYLEALGAANPNLTVGIVSDVHVNKKTMRAQGMFRKALEYFRDRHVDAVMITGDLAINGGMDELEVSAAIWREVFPNDRMPDGTKVEKLFLTGNHDTDGFVYSVKGTPDMEEVKRNSLYFDIERKWKSLYGEDYAPVVMKTVKGYPFVMMNWVSILGQESKSIPFAASLGLGDAKHPLAEWFKQNAAKLPKDRPFFFAQHKHPMGSCSSPFAHDCDSKSAEVLKNYPNCIAFSGHTHLSILEERTIWQGEYTSVGCGSLCGFTFTRSGRENGHGDGAEDGYEMPSLEFWECHQGMVMEVFDDRMVLERLDFKHEGVAKSAPDWVVPLGRNAPQPYLSKPREAASEIPQFAADAKVEVVEVASGKARKGEPHPQLEVRFPPVNGLNGGVRAFDYQVDCLESVDDIIRVYASERVYSPNALQPAKYDVKPVKAVFDRRKLPKGRKVRFEVRPINEWGKAGRPIESKIAIKI